MLRFLLDQSGPPLAAVAALLIATSLARSQSRTADLLITGGTVVDGTGGASRVADVAVTGDRITFVGDSRQARIVARRAIDARGLIVAPGFIDPHTHAFEDLSSSEAARRANTNYLMQGVTTVITGNDGGGPFEVASTLARWREQGIGTNAAVLVGYGTVRSQLLRMGDSRPTPVQLDSMKALVDRAMREGALGLSAGLYYAPQSYGTTEEVIELARVAARHGGLYDTHLRDESSYTIGLLGAVREAIRISREANLPLNISHIKALGVDVWGVSDSVIVIVEQARRSGLRVTADQYPYIASGSSIGSSLLPRWAEVGGRDSLRARAGDTRDRSRLVADMTENLRRRNGPEALLITSRRDTSIVGKTLAEVATRRGVTPVEAAIQIVLEGDASVASFNMSEKDVEAFMRRPWVMTGSDGSAGHPRKYGTYPKVYNEFVSGKKLLTLEQFVRRSSGLVAETFGVRERGTIQQGRFADVIVFDGGTFRDRSTYREPTLLAEGVRFVVVNGTVAIDSGRDVGAAAGRAIVRGTNP